MCSAPPRSPSSTKGTRIVVSGDYKRQHDPTCLPFEPVACDIFITEATFALPVFRHPPAEDEVAKLLKSVHQFPERAHMVGAYALGKAQRMIRLIREAGYDEPPPPPPTIYIHGALTKLCDFYHGEGQSTSAGSSPQRSTAPTRRGLQARSSSARPRPSPTAGSGVSPTPFPPSPRAGCASGSAPSSAAWNCR